MTAPFKPFYILFSFTLLLGIVIVISSNNWMTIWAGLELNLYSFIPLLLTSKSNQEKEAAIKYFLFQALASGLLLMNALASHLMSAGGMFLLVSLLMKLGMAPCHFWFPIVMNSISWSMCWVLSTLQKISPMLLLLTTLNMKMAEPIILISGLNALLGGFGGMNQTQLRPILAYSSIGHMGWMSSGMLSSTHISSWYFITYLFLVSAIIPTLSSFSMYSNKTSLRPLNAPQPNEVSLITALLSLGGMPPMLGFFPKMFMIMHLISNNMMQLALVLVIGSTLNLFYYMKIAFTLLLNSYSFQPFTIMYELPPRMLMISSLLAFSTFSGLLTLPFLML